MDAARFSPTWQQALAHGSYLGLLVSVVAVTAGLLAVLVAQAGTTAFAPPAWLWAVLTFAPPLVGALLGVLVRPRLSTEICAGGIRTVTPFGVGLEPWSRVVDLRAERRGARTVVSVYLESGASVQLQAPYSGELFAADPRFELKVFALSQLWRSHRFGGVPS
ncbi:hypothetical protein [Actinoplanes sp. NPDC049599]|uniref:hypothetical protein n=1 Tax=Actinoplanes sp. NPDC049599 TaxID=3363903 RepID=UPI00378A660B